MTIVAATRYGYVVEMSLIEAEQLTGESLRGSFDDRPQTGYVGHQFDISAQLHQVRRVREAEPELKRTAQTLRSLAHLMETNIPLVGTAETTKEEQPK